MGGAYGRLNHIYDDYNLTFNDIKYLLSELSKSSGVLYEKIDGMNLLMTYKDGQLLYARNKGMLLNPVPFDELISIFKPEVSEVFKEVCIILENCKNDINSNRLETLFNSGKYYLNIEIVSIDNVNVIKYDRNLLIFSSLMHLNDNIAKTFSTDCSELIDVFQEKNNSKYAIIAPAQLHSIPFNIDLDIIDLFCMVNELDLDSTLYDYFKYKILNEFDFYLKNISEEILYIIIERWVFDNKIKLTRNLLGNEYDSIKYLDKEIIPKFKYECKYELEHMFSMVINNLLMKLTGYLNEGKSSKYISELVFKELSKIEIYLKFKNRLVDFNNIIDCEGVVWYYNEHVYKLTGFFGIINQILGYERYGKR